MSKDIGKDLRSAWDNGFVTGVLALAFEFDLEEREVAEFLSMREHIIDFNSISEPKRTWYMSMMTGQDLQVPDEGSV